MHGTLEIHRLWLYWAATNLRHNFKVFRKSLENNITYERKILWQASSTKGLTMFTKSKFCTRYSGYGRSKNRTVVTCDVQLSGVIGHLKSTSCRGVVADAIVGRYGPYRFDPWSFRPFVAPDLFVPLPTYSLIFFFFLAMIVATNWCNDILNIYFNCCQKQHLLWNYRLLRSSVEPAIQIIFCIWEKTDCVIYLEALFKPSAKVEIQNSMTKYM